MRRNKLKLQKVVEWERKPDYRGVFLAAVSIYLFSFYLVSLAFSYHENPHWALILTTIIIGSFLAFFIHFLYDCVGDGRKVSWEEVK